MVRVLVFSTLYPNTAQPNHGRFVEDRLLQTRKRQELLATVVAPLPWFLIQGNALGRYPVYARVEREEQRDGVIVSHPRYLSIPKVGMTVAAALLGMGSREEFGRQVEAFGPDLIDAHYLYPDGVSAAKLAKRHNIPLVLTARGSDVNVLMTYRRIRRCLPSFPFISATLRGRYRITSNTWWLIPRGNVSGNSLKN